MWSTVKLHGLLACVPRGWAAEAESSFERWTARAFQAVHMLAPQLLSSMNLRRVRWASFFLSLLPSAWFGLLFCCGAMSLSALLLSKDERDKLIVARTPKKTVQATGLLVTQLPKSTLSSRRMCPTFWHCRRKRSEKSWNAISWTSGRKVVTCTAAIRMCPLKQRFNAGFRRPWP